VTVLVSVVYCQLWRGDVMNDAANDVIARRGVVQRVYLLIHIRVVGALSGRHFDHGRANIG